MSKQTTKAASKVAQESKGINVATQVERTFGKLAKSQQDALAALSRYNKHVLALLYHALCASLGISRQIARTKINAFIGTMHKGNKPHEFNNESFIAEAYKVDASGNYKAGTLDSYSQPSKFDFYSRDLPQALTHKQASELAVMVAGDFAASMFEALKKDDVLGKQVNSKASYKAVQKELTDKLAKLS